MKYFLLACFLLPSLFLSGQLVHLSDSNLASESMHIRFLGDLKAVGKQKVRTKHLTLVSVPNRESLYLEVSAREECLVRCHLLNHTGDIVKIWDPVLLEKGSQTLEFPLDETIYSDLYVVEFALDGKAFRQAVMIDRLWH